MCYQSNRNTIRTVGLDTLSIYSKPGMNAMKNALTRHENIVSFKEEEKITNNSIMSRCSHNTWDKLWPRINFGLGCLCTDTHTKALYLFMHGHTYKSTKSTELCRPIVKQCHYIAPSSDRWDGNIPLQTHCKTVLLCSSLKWRMRQKHNRGDPL